MSDPLPTPATATASSAARATPLTTGVATGVGSLPGVDPREAARVVVGELPDLPHLPELPLRGPGADMIGRAAALLIDLHVDLQPAGWRLVDRPGRDERRAASLLSADLDAFEEALESAQPGFAGTVKVQVAGPWTLAAALELPRGGRALSDPGARRDIADSLAEGAAAHVAQLSRRMPAASVVLQVDEPSLPAVLTGRVPTASGFDVIAAVEAADAESGLRAVIDAADAPVLVHCCAADPPVALAQRAGAAAVGVDLAALGERADEALGQAVEDRVLLALGVVPGTDVVLSDPAATVDPVRRMWRRLGFPAERLPGAVLLTPACGLAGATPGYARAAMARCRDAARRLGEDPAG